MLPSLGGFGDNFHCSLDAATNAEQLSPELASIGTHLIEPDFEFWFANEFIGFDTPGPHETVILDGDAYSGLGNFHN